MNDPLPLTHSVGVVVFILLHFPLVLQGLLQVKKRQNHNRDNLLSFWP